MTAADPGPHADLTEDRQLAAIMRRVDGLAPWLREREHADNCHAARWRIRSTASLCFSKASKIPRGLFVWAQCSSCGLEVTIECDG